MDVEKERMYRACRDMGNIVHNSLLEVDFKDLPKLLIEKEGELKW